MVEIDELFYKLGLETLHLVIDEGDFDNFEAAHTPASVDHLIDEILFDGICGLEGSHIFIQSILEFRRIFASEDGRIAGCESVLDCVAGRDFQSGRRLRAARFGSISASGVGLEF